MIFYDGFESGDTSRWDTESGSCVINAGSALVGVFGFEATQGDYVEDQSPGCETIYNVRFYIDPNTVGINDLQEATILIAYKDISTQIIKVDIRKSLLKWQIRCYAIDDFGKWRTTAWYNITDEAHYVEFNWTASLNKNLFNGSLAFWIDGIQKLNIIDLNNDKACINFTRFGIIDYTDTITGSIYLDQFESRRQTHIGA